MIETANDAGAFERTAIANDGSDRTLDLRKNASGEVTFTRYTHGADVDEPLSLETFSVDGIFQQSYVYHTDHLGSVRFRTNSVGEIADSYEYESYGRPGVTLEEVAQPFRYTGREWDAATGLYYYRARHYDPETGRFLQEDPTWFSAGDLNIHRYVSSNPINFRDPTGLFRDTTGQYLGNRTSTGSKTATEYTAVTSIGLRAAGGAAKTGCELNKRLTGIASLIEGAGSGTFEGLKSLGVCETEAKFRTDCEKELLDMSLKIATFGKDGRNIKLMICLYPENFL